MTSVFHLLGDVFRFLLSIIILILCAEGNLHAHSSYIEQICSDASEMLRSGLSQHEVNEYLRGQINRNFDKLKKKNGVNNEQYHRSLGDDESTKIDVSTNNQVGKNGQLFRVNNIATGSAINSNNFPLFYQQDNNIVNESELNELLVFITLGVSVGGVGSKKNRDKNNPVSVENLPRISTNPIKKCRDMIEAIRGKAMERSDPPVRDQSGNESYSSSRGGNNDADIKTNSTRIRTRYDIGFGGYMANSDNIATGQSTTNIGSELGDVQTHSDFKNSVVKIFRLDVTPIGLNVG